MTVEAVLATRFGDELAVLMRDAGLSYRQVAERAGISAGHLNSVANGRRGYRVTDRLIEAVAPALDVEPAAFSDYRRRRVIERLAGEHFNELFGRRP